MARAVNGWGIDCCGVWKQWNTNYYVFGFAIYYIVWIIFNGGLSKFAVYIKQLWLYRK